MLPVLLQGLTTLFLVADPLPEGPGLAAKYPGDRGIADDPRVVFVENFEQATIEDTFKRWETVSQREQFTHGSDRPAQSGGKKSLLVQHIGGKGESVYLYRRFDPGHEKLFVRFYVKFDQDCAPVHHFFHIGGYQPSTPYPQGGAGVRPRGNERFTVGIEPNGKNWVWDYYAYWQEMQGSPPRGQTWGNHFLGSKQPKVPRDQWICVEAMLKLNTVGESDGELALWIDGKRMSHVGQGFPRGKWIFGRFLPGEGGESLRWNDDTGKPQSSQVPADGKPFEGFRWRNDERQKINFLWLLTYITQTKPDQVSKIWFDEIVVAREYIGPIGTDKK